jgi:hypothetical protein
MARAGHFGDCSASFKRHAGELFRLLGMKLSYDALTEIRRIRDKPRERHGGPGNSDWKTIVKILLAERDGLPWQWAFGRRIEYIVPASKGGRDVLENIRLSDH